MAELVAVDVGNSRIHCGRFIDGELQTSWVHDSEESRKAASSIAIQYPKATVYFSSVVPAATMELSAALSEEGLAGVDIRLQAQRAVPGGYESLGTDRLANAYGGWKVYGHGQPVIVLDMGTATTLTAVSAQGKFMGGFITLGLGTTLLSLSGKAAQLPEILLNQPPEVQLLAMNTGDAMAVGTILAHQALIESWIKVARSLLGQNALTIATGGWSSLLSHYANFQRWDPALTLKGICLIALATADPADPA